MDDFKIGQDVIVIGEPEAGKVVGYIGDMILVRFKSGYTEKFYPHELFYEQEE